MYLIGKYIFLFFVFSGFLFFYSDGIQKTENIKDRAADTEWKKINCPAGKECKELIKHDIENPDYVPAKCGDCPNRKNDYWHQDIVGDRECYFGNSIKKQN